MMDLDDFSDYKIRISDDKECLIIRHQNCPNLYVERIPLERPLRETNLKWLMLRATTHWQEVHSGSED